MADKKPIPTIAFDPAKHVIAGREAKEGRQLFFTLGAIVEAEKQIEKTAPEPPPAIPQVTFDDLAKLEERVVKAAREVAPPPQFPAALMSTITDLTAAIVKMKSENEGLKARVEKLESDVAVHTQNFAEMMKLARGKV